MKQLVDLMEQRTAIMNQLRAAKMTVGQLEGQLQSLAQEVEWRSSVLGLSESPKMSLPTITVFPQGPQFDPGALTQPIFVQPPQPESQKDRINRGHADLRSLS